MARNIEIKARITDLEAFARRVAEIADIGPIVNQQEDTYFHSPKGRLKLRECAGGSSELIYYERPDSSSPSESRYFLCDASKPAELRRLLDEALGIRAVVRKRRVLFLVGQTRVHLDEVEDLGTFVELEVVLEDGQSSEEGMDVARSLMDSLGIRLEHLVASAYVDLLEARQTGDPA